MGQGMNLMMARIRQVLWRSRAYKRLFLDPQSNDLSEDGRIVVAHLKRFATAWKASGDTGSECGYVPSWPHGWPAGNGADDCRGAAPG
jgi:hypothetical protein